MNKLCINAMSFTVDDEGAKMYVVGYWNLCKNVLLEYVQTIDLSYQKKNANDDQWTYFLKNKGLYKIYMPIDFLIFSPRK